MARVPVMAAFCHKCGAKFNEKRIRCPRCLEPVANASGRAAAPSSGANGPWLLANNPWLVGAGLSFLVLVAAAVSMWPDADNNTPPAQAEPARRPTASPRQRVQSAPSATALTDRSFMDSGRSGNAAYVQGDFGRAMEEYQQAIRKNPDDSMSLNNLGQVLVRAGRTTEAIPYFTRAIELNTSVWAPRFNLARAYSQLGDFPKAIDEYQVAATLMPDDYVTVYNLGLARHKSGDEEGAIKDFQHAVELAPSEASFHLSMGISYERLKRPAEAAQAYENYLTLAPEAADAAQVRARIQALKNAS